MSFNFIPSREVEVPEIHYENELVLQKNRYDGFYGSPLEHYLSHVWKVQHVVIVGTVSNICVAHTAEFDQAMTLRQVTSLYAGKIVRSTDDVSFRQVIEVDS
jgi:nicotinamidase-related amidase